MHLLCGADDVSAQTAHWAYINYTRRMGDYLNGATEIPFGGICARGKESTPMLQESYMLSGLFLFNNNDIDSFIHSFMCLPLTE